VSRPRRTALITGGTAGIGAAFARRLAADSYDLVLVARDAARLETLASELAAEHGITVTALPADLATGAGVAAVAERLGDAGAPVDLLINNAGIGLRRSFLRTTAEEQEHLLRLNVHAVMRLTLAALPGMVQRRHGGVINVSSASAFGATLPGSTYPATKAWVNNFSESIAPTVRRHGVRVLALCPGFVRTEFHARNDIDMSRLPDWLWLDADDVAAAGLRALARGRVVSVTDWRYRLFVTAMRFTPRRLFAAVVRRPSPRIRRDGIGG
jgi:hypothetical protein